MPVPAIELRPRGPVALLDAAIRLCTQDAGLWSLAFTGGALVTAAAIHLMEAIRARGPLLWPSLLFVAAWFVRGLLQGAACHHVERLVLDPSVPGPWASLRAALARAPSLFMAVGVLAMLNTLSLGLTLGIGFFFFTAHLAGYAAAMRGVGHPLGLYRTCTRLLGDAVGGSLVWVRLAFWVQVLVALNVHMGANALILLGRKLLALDLTFADRYASLDNPGWVLAVIALTFALVEPLRAAVAALLLIDGRVRQEGLDLMAALEQLPRRQRSGRSATRAGAGLAAALLLALLAPGETRAEGVEEGSAPVASTAQPPPRRIGRTPARVPEDRPAMNEAVLRLEGIVTDCGGEPSELGSSFTAARQLGERERASLARFVSELESLVHDDGDCEVAMERLGAGLALIMQARDTLEARGGESGAAVAREKAREILARPEFQRMPAVEEKPEPPEEEPKPAEDSWWGRLMEWIRKKLEELGRERRPRPLPERGLLAPGSGAGLADILVVLLTLLVLAVFGFLLIRLKPRPRREGAPLELAQPGAGEAGTLDGQNALSRPPEGWATLADQLAARGEYREAVRSLYLALLSRLHREGVIDYDPAQSNWEYVRRFRGPRDWVPPFRELTTRFDYAYYGNLGVDPEGYHRFRELSGPLLTTPARAPAGAAEAPRA